MFQPTRTNIGPGDDGLIEVRIPCEVHEKYFYSFHPLLPYFPREHKIQVATAALGCHSSRAYMAQQQLTTDNIRQTRMEEGAS